MKIEGNRWRVRWSQCHFPRFGRGCIPVRNVAGKGTVGGFGFADIGLVVE